MTALRKRLSSGLYRYGLETGVPYSLLKGCNELLDIADRPLEYLARRRLAADLLRDSGRRGFMPRAAGYCTFGPGEIAGFDRLTEIAQAIYRQRAETDLTLQPASDLSPMALLLQPEDFAAWPEMLQITLGREVVEIVADYLGAIPRLDNIDLWVTRPNVRPEGPYGSQLFHLDKPDRHYLSIFLNVFDVGAENGPLTFLPAPETATICSQTDYARHYYLDDGRLPDDVVFGAVPQHSVVEFIGPAGSGGMVDTSECLHFGSRCRAGQRVLFVMTFMPAHKPGTSGSAKFAHVRPRLAEDVTPLERRLADLLLPGTTN